MPAATAVRRDRDRSLPPGGVGDGHGALVTACAGEHPGQLGHTGADAAGDGDDLARAHGQRDAVEAPGAQAAGDEARLPAGDSPGRGADLLDLPAEHRRDDLLRREVERRALLDDRAVAQHGDVVGHLEHLVEVVGDEQHGHAGGAQLGDHPEQRLDLVAAERGGRLVHHDHPRVEADGAGDLQQLQLGDRQRARRAADVEVQAERVEARLGRCAGTPASRPGRTGRAGGRAPRSRPRRGRRRSGAPGRSPGCRAPAAPVGWRASPAGRRRRRRRRRARTRRWRS